MVEEGGDGDFATELVAGHEVDRQGASALRGLRVGCLYAPYKRLIVAQSEVEIHREVVADSSLRTAELDNPVEVGNLPASSY